MLKWAEDMHTFFKIYIQYKYEMVIVVSGQKLGKEISFYVVLERGTRGVRVDIGRWFISENEELI